MTFPILPGRAEAVFGVHGISTAAHRIQVRAKTRRWREGPEGDAPAGVLGVVADNVSGYAIITGAPPGHWSVTTELSLDVVGRVPTDGTHLMATAELLDHGRHTGYSSGTIVDAAGRIVAHVRQRGLYVPGVPDPGESTEPGSREDLGTGSLGALFGRAGPAGEPFASVDIEAHDDLVNPLGNLHGGIGVCLADWVGNASFRSGTDAPLRTTSIHAVYLRPAPLGSHLRISSTVVHRGRNLGLSHVTAVNSVGKPVLIATVTAGSA